MTKINEFPFLWDKYQTVRGKWLKSENSDFDDELADLFDELDDFFDIPIGN